MKTSGRNGGRDFDYRRIDPSNNPKGKSLMSSKSQELFDIARGRRGENNGADYPEDYASPMQSLGPMRKSHSGYHSGSGSHPYRRSQQVPDNYDDVPIMIEPNNKPPPLIPPETVEQLRATLRNSTRRLETTSFEMPTVTDENFDMDAYLREEEETKRTIDEIIMVAQALRDKLDREEELRRSAIASASASVAEVPTFVQSGPSRALLAESSSPGEIPRLMDLKPKIPSLLEINVPPPFVEPDNYMPERSVSPEVDSCWNCDRFGHTYLTCKYPQMRKFCYRCGQQGYDLNNCPYCM